MPDEEHTTWDGQPISREKPHGATIVVYRSAQRGTAFLILHRTYNGPGYEGEWAWTPPSGARTPGEAVEDCARRELLEETSLSLDITLTGCGTPEWWVYMAQCPADSKVRLSQEHDRFEWLPVEDAARKCAPDAVSGPLQAVAELLEQSERDQDREA